MQDFLLLIFLSLIGGFFSLIGGIVLLYTHKRLRLNTSYLISFAAGVLLSVALLDLLPEASENVDPHNLGLFVLIGVLLLFLFEKTHVWWHHHHEPHGHNPEIVSIFLGDTLHNFIDGLAIGAAFLVSPILGISTALAVALHEIPQELADFSIYIKHKLKPSLILTANITSSLATLVGALLVYIFKDTFDPYVYPLLAITAGMFLFISLSDLIPDLHIDQDNLLSVNQLYIFLLGIVITYAGIIVMHA